jgi:hypothetical protein
MEVARRKQTNNDIINLRINNFLILRYMETSARNGNGVKEMFEELGEALPELQARRERKAALENEPATENSGGVF